MVLKSIVPGKETAQPYIGTAIPNAIMHSYAPLLSKQDFSRKGFPEESRYFNARRLRTFWIPGVVQTQAFCLRRSKRVQLAFAREVEVPIKRKGWEPIKGEVAGK